MSKSHGICCGDSLSQASFASLLRLRISRVVCLSARRCRSMSDYGGIRSNEVDVFIAFPDIDVAHVSTRRWRRCGHRSVSIGYSRDKLRFRLLLGCLNSRIARQQRRGDICRPFGDVDCRSHVACLTHFLWPDTIVDRVLSLRIYRFPGIRGI